MFDQKNHAMRHPARMLLRHRIQSFGVLLVASLLAGCDPQASVPPKTSSDARPVDVAFVTLPSDATSIRFWDDDREQLVVFETTEAKYRAMFPDVQFAEIAEKVWYPIRGFGDPANPPRDHPDPGTEASNGLVLELPAPKGGVMYLYDRATGTGYYHKNLR